MKSAYEIAMERMEAEAGPVRKLTDEEKEQVAELDRKYDARVAEIKLALEGKIAVAPPEESEALQQELAHEVARLEEKRASDKEKIWSESQGQS